MISWRNLLNNIWHLFGDHYRKHKSKYFDPYHTNQEAYVTIHIHLQYTRCQCSLLRTHKNWFSYFYWPIWDFKFYFLPSKLANSRIISQKGGLWMYKDLLFELKEQASHLNGIYLINSNIFSHTFQYRFFYWHGVFKFRPPFFPPPSTEFLLEAGLTRITGLNHELVYSLNSMNSLYLYWWLPFFLFRHEHGHVRTHCFIFTLEFVDLHEHILDADEDWMFFNCTMCMFRESTMSCCITINMHVSYHEQNSTQDARRSPLTISRISGTYLTKNVWFSSGGESMFSLYLFDMMDKNISDHFHDILTYVL